MKLTTALWICLASVLPSTNASATLDDLARDLSRQESLRSIKNLQRTFAQLAQFGRYESIGSLFSNNATFQWGNATVSGGPSAISSWLTSDAGSMNGLTPGSLDTLIIETPLINLDNSGTRALGRWNGLRFQGSGTDTTRIQGGIYENEYILSNALTGEWKISKLHYYALYDSKGRSYKEGWRNIDQKGLPIVPYHFTPSSAGVPVAVPSGPAPPTSLTVQEIETRIRRLNEEDEVRNLMHAHGYYVDRRLWTDVVDLHSNNTRVIIRGGAGRNFTGLSGVREALERMGPEGLVAGVNNDHPIFNMVVEVAADGKSAVARGTEIGMIGDISKNRSARWEFNVFRNTFVKEGGIWKVQIVDITPVIVADYYVGWGNGGINPPNSYIPPFLNVTSAQGLHRRKELKNSWKNKRGENTTTADLVDLARRLARSAAYDGAENMSTAYGYLLDDLDCAGMGALFAKRGHKASPFAGFFITPERIAQACFTSYGTNRSALRNSISFHWRPQPVILVSEDGRSATLRARLLQPSTSTSRSGSFNSAIYHDQMVLEDGVWRLWSVTIDEFYWQSSSWEGGWSAANPRNASAPNPGGAEWTKRYPPDISIAGVGERESTFRGGSGKYIEWPDIQRMWWQYRNPVSGRKPEWYWPGCVPCKAMPGWALESNGYQEPVDWPWLARNGTVVRR